MATDYSKYNESQYKNQSTYLDKVIATGTAGQKAWAQAEKEALNSQYKPQTTQPSGNNVTNSGSVNTVNKPAQSQGSTTSSNNAFISPGSQVNENGTRYHSWGENDQYKKKDYLSGNADLQYTLEQRMERNGTNKYDLDGYVKELYGSVGTQRADGSTITLADVDKELDRLGLSDYNSQNVTHTAGGSLIPKNEFVTTQQGSFGSNSDDSQWTTYGDRTYLTGGSDANFIDYVNGKTGNTTNLDFIFDDMANNPYAKEDAEFAQWYQNSLNQFNNTAGITPTTGTGGSYTGFDKVDQFIDSVNGYNQATGGTSNIWSEVQAMLQGGYEAQQAFIDSQKTQAEQNAEDLMRQAYVNQKLQGDSVKEAMSAAGLGATGAMQSAMLGVQSNYNNNVADIHDNLNTMLSSFSEQELQALTDFMNKSTEFYYQIQNDMQDRAYQNAQLYMQQAQMQQAQEQQKWENWYKQQVLDFENQQYTDSQTQYQSETDYAQRQDAAEYYAQLFDAGMITAEQYQQFLTQLGLIPNASFSSAGSDTGNPAGSKTPSGEKRQEQDEFSLTPSIAYGGTTGNTVSDYANNQNTRDREMAYALWQSGLLDDSASTAMIGVMANGALEYALQHAKDEVLRDMPVEVARAWIAQKLS